MILVLDAHVLLWWLADHPTLDRQARAAIRAPTNEVIVSAATVWEVEIKRALGKLEAPDGLLDAISAAGFTSVPITPMDATRAARLPAHHRDPFDRMLVAQAIRLDGIVVSRDPSFAAYGVEVLPA